MNLIFDLEIQKTFFAPYNLVQVYHHFRDVSCLHHQGYHRKGHRCIMTAFGKLLSYRHPQGMNSPFKRINSCQDFPSHAEASNNEAKHEFHTYNIQLLAILLKLSLKTL